MEVLISTNIKNKDEYQALTKQLGPNFKIELQETRLTKAEKGDLKKYLYEELKFLATERPEFFPKKGDSLDLLMESYFFWAEEYNEGYFPERDDAENNKLFAYLVEQYEFHYMP